MAAVKQHEQWQAAVGATDAVTVPEQGTESMAQPKPFGGTGTAPSAATEVI